MLAGIRKRLARKPLDIKECEDDDKDDLHPFTPPTNFIKISQGKIQLVHQTRSLENNDDVQGDKKDKEVLEGRIVELEEALLRLQEKVNNSQCASPTFEKELREQLENMNRVMKSKERKQMQTFRDHKALQTRFARQECLLHAMQQENKALLMRIRQYEHCLDDVMRKVVDAIVAEDNLREEVAMLKSRVRDLEAQNAALSASPAKGRDEGYCTMSSGQPQPSNGHLEDLPEEPEQWLLPQAEPCSTEMEDWSMSQEELAVITLDEEREREQHHQQQQQRQQLRQQRYLHQTKQNCGAGSVGGGGGGGGGSEHDWIWNSNDFLNSTIVETDSASDSITQLLQQKIVYSEDEEVACTEFTNDFYKLVNIRSNSTRSLYSYIEGETDDEDEDEDDDDDDDDDDEDSSLSNNNIRLRLEKNSATTKLKGPSPTPSEAGRAQVTSCSSSETDELSHRTAHEELGELKGKANLVEPQSANTSSQQHDSDIEIEDVQLHRVDQPQSQQQKLNEQRCIEKIIKTELRKPPLPPPPQQLVKSKSTLDEDEPSCILRNNQRREIESSVVRSGSVNCAIASKIAKGITTTGLNGQRTSAAAISTGNSWRKSNGWKRITSPTQTSNALISPKRDIKSNHATSKVIPTRIPTCIPMSAITMNTTTTTATINAAQQQPTQQTQPVRKSKIPPPVPVRRSYAS